MSDPAGMEKAKRPILIPNSLTKLARTALIYPMRFTRSTAKSGVEFSLKVYALNGLVMMAAVICGYGSLLGELNSFRKGQSHRFKNVTVAVLACFNYTMSVLPTAIAVLGSASRHAAWLDIERLLDRVDETLDTRGDCTAADKRVERCTVWLVWVQVVVFAVDYYIWITVNQNNKSYGIIYLFQYVNLVSMAVYAQLAWCIGRRFDNVNREIEAKLERMTTLNRVEFVNRQYHNLSDLLRWSDNRIKDVKYIPTNKFQEMYWSLCCSVNIINQHYGSQLLASLVLNIMNLIAFPNIMITRFWNKALFSPFIYGFAIVYVVWFFCHLAILFLLVVPSSYAASKAEHTAVIICKYLNSYLIPDEMKQVIGIIITYAAIFIQLQNK